jgi:uncharacterized YigZ family protein
MDRIPANEIESEIFVLKSRFIASVAPAFSVDEAKAYIKGIKLRYPDATHHVTAYIIGHPPSTIAHSNDDGEPSGTAGRPVLAYLQGSGLGDIVAVVTRYYGGTKLGTGGLVRAYSTAVKEALTILPLAQKIPTTTVELNLDYKWYDPLLILISKFNGEIQEKDFSENITISVKFSNEKWKEFELALLTFSNASIKPIMLQHDNDTIVPI